MHPRRIARTTVAAAVALAAGLATPGPAPASGLYLASGNGALAYSTTDTTQPVFTVWQNGTHSTLVRNGLVGLTGVHTVKGWTGDGNRLILSTAGDASVKDLNPWTSTLVRTVSDPNGLAMQNPSVSPDGTQFAYGTIGNGIRILDADDNLTSFMAHASAGTSWSNTGPSGDRLVWINDRADAGEVNDDPGLFVSNDAQANPTGNIHGVDLTNVFPEHVSISKTGLYLAYDFFNGAGSQDNYDIRVGAAENGGPVSALAISGSATYQEQFPAMSPDGTKLAFVSDRIGGGNEAIYIVNRNGTGLSMVPGSAKAAGTYTGLSWQPGTAPGLAPIGVDGATEVGSTVQPEWTQDTGTAPMTYSYQWQRCDDNPVATNCASVSGATSSTYSVTSADLGKRLRVVRAATNPVGTDTRASDVTTEAVTDPPPPDTTPPGVPTIDVKPAARSNATAPLFAWTGAEAGGTYQCSVDAAAYTGCTSSSSFPVSGEGAHTFRVRQVDAAGNLGDPAEHTWTLDVTGPGTPTVASRPSASTSSTSARFTFTGAEPGGSFECRYGADGAPWLACTSPTDLSGLSEGAKRFSIRQVDQAGNPSEPEVTTWTVDTTAPATPTISTTPGARSNTTAPTFAWTGAEAGGSFRCSVDGGAYATCTSGSSFPVGGEGAHSFRVRQVDAAGNPGDPAEHTWTLDTVAPTPPTLTTKPAASSSATAPVFAWTGAEPGGTYECALDNGAFAACTSGSAVAISGQGSHVFEVRQVDAAGNAGAVVTYTWTLDTVGPGTPDVTSRPAPRSRSTPATIAFSGAEAGGTFQCQLGSGSWVPCASPLIMTGFSDGAKVVRIRQVDAAGNHSPDPAVVEWTVDTVAPAKPTITEGSALVRTYGTAFRFVGEAGLEGAGGFSCRVDDGSWGSCSSPAPVTGYAPGPHVFRVRETDAAGNDGAVESFAFVADFNGPAAPALVSGPAGHTSSPTATFAFHGADNTDDRLECRLDGGAWESCVPTRSYTGLADGEHGFDVRQLDENGNPGEVTSRTWTVDTRRPAEPGLQGMPPAETTASSIDVRLNGEPDARMECRVDDGLWRTCSTRLQLDDVALGAHRVDVRQIDLAGNVGDVRSFAWTVVAPRSDTPQAPGTGAAPATTTTVKPAPPVAAPATPTPKLTAVLGGAGKGASGATIVVKRNGVGVGCAITGTVLTSCTVDLYADAAGAARTHATKENPVLVGTGTHREASGATRMQVAVALNATGRALLRRSPGGLRVRVRITGTPAAGTRLRATGTATLASRHLAARVTGFAVRSATLTRGAKRRLARLATQVRGTTAAIRVTGHTDASSSDAGYLRDLGARRARTVAAFLRAHGVKARVTLASRGSRDPVASNATATGRAQNRRVELRIDR